MKLSRQTILIVVTAVLASLLEIIDTSIVNVAVPHMMGNLGATLEDISWVITGYVLANAIVLPIAGWLGMQIGRRVYYTGCILLFTATSVGCGLSPNLGVLVFFRILQGLAGGALLPTSQALIQEAFPGEKAGIGSAIYGMSIMIGPTLGPTLGGYLTDNFGWRMIFNINLPLGLLAAAMAWANVTDYDAVPRKATPAPGTVSETASAEPAVKQKRQRTPIDVVGLILLVVGIGSLQYFLERGQADDWFDSRTITASFFAALIAVPGFIWWELKTAHPIMDLRLFKHQAVRYGTFLMMQLGNILYTLIFLIPVFSANILGLTATQTGMLFIPGAFLAALMMPIIGFNLRKGEARWLILTGVIGVEAALLLMRQFTPLTSSDDMFFALLLRGAAMAYLFVPINTAVLSQFTGYQLGQVAGMMNLFRQIGGSIGIATAATLLKKFQDEYYVILTSRISALNPLTYNQIQGIQMSMKSKLVTATGFMEGNRAMLQLIDYRIRRQTFVLSMDKIFTIFAFIFLISLFPLSRLKMKKHTGPLDMH